MIPTIPMKRGDTFALTCQYAIDGVDQPIDAATITSTVRAPDGSVAFECVVTKLSPREDGKVYDYTVRAETGVTGLAPIGRLVGDIRYEWSDGRVGHSYDYVVLLGEART